LGGIVVLVARTGKYIIVAATLSVFGGCQAVGPIAIDVGRDRYNNIIQSTSKQQAFANIIRVHNNEPTSFVDVTEVDASQTFTGTVSGSVTGIGARAGTSGGTLAGQVGSVTPGVSYSENPIIRYVPLVGQGLVEQTVAPINTDALAALSDSGWPVMPLVDLAMPFLTPDPDDVGVAVNLIAELDYDNRLRLSSTKSDWTKKPDDSVNSSNGQGSTSNSGSTKKTPTSSSTNDTLAVYFLTPRGSTVSDQRDSYLWGWLMGLYKGTQLPLCSVNRYSATNKDTTTNKESETNKESTTKKETTTNNDSTTAKESTTTKESTTNKESTAEKQSQNCMLETGQFIELRTGPVTKNPNPFRYTAPLMRTYSALGILKSAAQPPNPRIAFVSPGDFERIAHQYWWNDPGHNDSLLSVYTLDPDDLQLGDEQLSHATALERRKERAEQESVDHALKRWFYDSATPHPLPYVYWQRGVHGDELAKLNDRLWQLRRYMLIIQSDAPPPANAYVAYFDRGFWYYIDGEDRISQKNFNLISLFLTVMAIPPANPPLTTSISIGGG
jgi:hypothetical protein